MERVWRESFTRRDRESGEGAEEVNSVREHRCKARLAGTQTVECEEPHDCDACGSPEKTCRKTARRELHRQLQIFVPVRLIVANSSLSFPAPFPQQTNASSLAFVFIDEILNELVLDESVALLEKLKFRRLLTRLPEEFWPKPDILSEGEQPEDTP